MPLPRSARLLPRQTLLHWPFARSPWRFSKRSLPRIARVAALGIAHWVRFVRWTPFSPNTPSSALLPDCEYPMIKEIHVFGIYVAPFAAYLFCTGLIFVPVRMWFDRIEIQKWVWHRPLFEVAVFLIVLSFISLVFLL